MAELCVKVAEFIVTLIRESLDLFRRIDSTYSSHDHELLVFD